MRDRPELSSGNAWPAHRSRASSGGECVDFLRLRRLDERDLSRVAQQQPRHQGAGEAEQRSDHERQLEARGQRLERAAAGASCVRGGQRAEHGQTERAAQAGTGVGRRRVEHPIAGPMVFEHAVFNPSEAPDQRLVLYTPLPEEDTAAKLARLLR
jgi:hypothetical protein